jgi:hypothetical protein
VGTSVISIAVCIAACGLNPPTDVAVDKVDLVEINHFHDDQGRPVFDQIIFYDWSARDGRYQVRDWRLLKSANQVPLSNSRDREFVAVWSDFKIRDTLRSTKAKMVRETWTQYDPELVEREFLPENKRKKLKDIPAKINPVSSTGNSPATTPGAATTEPPSANANGPLRPLQSPAARPQ